MEIFVFGAKKAFKIAKNVVSKSYNMEIRSLANSYNMGKKRSGRSKARPWKVLRKC